MYYLFLLISIVIPTKKNLSFSAFLALLDVCKALNRNHEEIEIKKALAGHPSGQGSKGGSWLEPSTPNACFPRHGNLSKLGKIGRNVRFTSRSVALRGLEWFSAQDSVPAWTHPKSSVFRRFRNGREVDG